MSGVMDVDFLGTNSKYIIYLVYNLSRVGILENSGILMANTHSESHGQLYLYDLSAGAVFQNIFHHLTSSKKVLERHKSQRGDLQET